MTQRIRVTNHAINRYQERVKPALDFVASRDEVEALVALAPRQSERPFPINEDVDGPVCDDADCWLELAPGIWAAGVTEGSTLIVVTVIAHSGVSPERRQRRNEAKANARKARQRRRREHLFIAGERRHRMERWK